MTGLHAKIFEKLLGFIIIEGFVDHPLCLFQADHFLELLIGAAAGLLFGRLDICALKISILRINPGAELHVSPAFKNSLQFRGQKTFLIIVDLMKKSIVRLQRSGVCKLLQILSDATAI